MTKKQLISDVILRISAGKPSDDLELEPKQVAFWVDQVLNALVKKTLDDRVKIAQGIDPVYQFSEYNKSVNYSLENGKATFYLNLDNDVLNLNRDAGIIRLSNTDDYDLVDKVDIKDLDVLMNLRFSKPSIKNLKYSRIRNRVYLYGIDSDTYQINKFDIVYVPVTKVLEELKDDDIIYVGEDLIPIIAEAVTQNAREQLNSIDDLDNDAVEIPTNPQQTK